MNIGTQQALIVEKSDQRPIYVCMTSAHDVARFLVATLELGLENWPAEFRMCGERLSIQEILWTGESVYGGTCKYHHSYVHY